MVARRLDEVRLVARRILVADDQSDILQALRLLLGDAGFDTDLVNITDGAI